MQPFETWGLGDRLIRYDPIPMWCVCCHSMRSGKNAQLAAPKACLNCHHTGAYECGNCHGVEQ